MTPQQALKEFLAQHPLVTFSHADLREWTTDALLINQMLSLDEVVALGGSRYIYEEGVS